MSDNISSFGEGRAEDRNPATPLDVLVNFRRKYLSPDAGEPGIAAPVDGESAKLERLRTANADPAAEWWEASHEVKDLQAKVDDLKAELECVRQQGRAQRTQYDTAFARVFLQAMKWGEPKRSLAEAVTFVTQHDGTPEAASLAKEQFLTVLGVWADKNRATASAALKPQYGRFDAWTSRVSRLAHTPGLVAGFEPHVRVQWGQALTTRAEAVFRTREARYLLEAEASAIANARRAIETEAAPELVLQLFRAALVAYYDVTHHLGRTEKLAADFEQWLAKIEEASSAKQAQAAPSQLAGGGNPGTRPAVSAQAQDEDDEGEVRSAEEDTSYASVSAPATVRDWDDDLWEPAPSNYDPYPCVNPTSGLPMMGGGSCLDVGGHVFGDFSQW